MKAKTWPCVLLLVALVSFMVGRLFSSCSSDMAVPRSTRAAVVVVPKPSHVIENGSPLRSRGRQGAPTQQAVQFFLRNKMAVKKYLQEGRAPPSPATVVCVVGISDVVPQVLSFFDTDGVLLFVDPSTSQEDRDNFTTSVEQSPSGRAVTVHRYVGPPATSIRQFAIDYPEQKCHVVLLADELAWDPDMVMRFLHTQSFHGATGHRNVVLASDAWRDKRTPPPKGGVRGVAPAFELILPLEQDGLGFPPASQLSSEGFVVGRFEHVMHFPNQQLAKIIEHGLWKNLSLDPYFRISAALIKSARTLLESEKKRKAYIEGNSGELIVERQIYATIAALPQIKTICEIGFNAGHSASLWLKANPTADVYMFDLFAHRYGTHNDVFLRSEEAKTELDLVDVSRRLKTFRGFSQIIVPQFVKDFPNVKCELLSVDGGHFGDIPYVDIMNMRRLANKTFHVLVMDDTNCDPHMCGICDSGILRHGSNLSVLLRAAELRDGHDSHIFHRGVTVMQYAPSFLEN